MSTWPNRGASGGPCGGLEERKTEPKTVRPSRSDSSKPASSKPGAVHSVAPGKIGEIVWRFTKAGNVDFACLQPGHYDAGMKGMVNVASSNVQSKGQSHGEHAH